MIARDSDRPHRLPLAHAMWYFQSMYEDSSRKSHTQRIAARIAEQIAGADGVDTLTNALSPTDLQSLMLHVYAERSRRRGPAELLAQFEQSALLQPSSVEASALLNIELRAL